MSDESQAECPVCMNSCHTSRKFPCGHGLCASCDDSMLMRNQHRCPLCRTPRQGFTQAEADQAAQEEIQIDRVREAIVASAGVSGRGVLTRVSHGRRNYEVMFFANESSGSMPPNDADEQAVGEVAAAATEQMPRERVDMNGEGITAAQASTQAIQEIQTGNYVPIEVTRSGGFARDVRQRTL